MSKYAIIACNVMWRELSYYASISQNNFEFHFLKQGLHNTPDLLKNELQSEIDNLTDEYEAVLIGYGLCSNGIQGITSKKNKLIIMKGHDCITFFLGSKERYMEYFNNNPGTYWYTSGWIESTLQPGKERYEKTLKQYTQKYGEDNAEYLMEMEQDWFNKYSNAAYIDFDFFNSEKYKQYTKECSEWLKWSYNKLSGDPKLFIDFVNGNWDSERFLIVEPGKMVVATNDVRILGTQTSI